MKDNNIYRQIVFQTAFCASHPRSRLGRNQKTHEWFKQCIMGYRNMQNGEPSGCEIIIEETQ